MRSFFWCHRIFPKNLQNPICLNRANENTQCSPSSVISVFARSPTPQRSSISTSSQGRAHPSDLPHPQLYSHRLSPIPSCCHQSSQSSLIGITVFVPRSERAASHHSHHHLWGETAPSIQVESGRAITSICFNQVLEG